MAQPKIATKSNGTQQAISTNKFWDNLNQIRINTLENLSIKIRKIKSKFIMENYHSRRKSYADLVIDGASK